MKNFAIGVRELNSFRVEKVAQIIPSIKFREIYSQKQTDKKLKTTKPNSLKYTFYELTVHGEQTRLT